MKLSKGEKLAVGALIVLAVLNRTKKVRKSDDPLTPDDPRLPDWLRR